MKKLYNCGCYYSVIDRPDKYACINKETFFELVSIFKGVYRWTCTHGGWTVGCDYKGKILEYQLQYRRFRNLKDFKLTEFYENYDEYKKAYEENNENYRSHIEPIKMSEYMQIIS